MPGTDYKTFDYGWAVARLGDDSELLAELAGLFAIESGPLVASLRAAVAERDGRGIENAAHALKGSISNFGAKAVWEDARALEQCGREREFAQVDNLLAAFERSYAGFVDELRTVGES